MLDLAPSQIYTRVFRLRKSVALDNAWVRVSRPFIFFCLVCSRSFRVGISKYVYLLKMLDLARSQIYTRVFHLWKSID